MKDSRQPIEYCLHAVILWRWQPYVMLSSQVKSMCQPPGRYLKQADLAECGRQKQLIRRVRDLEAAVAQRVGVSMVYSSSQLQLQSSYLHFLERLASGAATQGTVGSGSLPLCSSLPTCCMALQTTCMPTTYSGWATAQWARGQPYAQFLLMPLNNAWKMPYAACILLSLMLRA